MCVRACVSVFVCVCACVCGLAFALNTHSHHRLNILRDRKVFNLCLWLEQLFSELPCPLYKYMCPHSAMKMVL